MMMASTPLLEIDCTVVVSRGLQLGDREMPGSNLETGKKFPGSRSSRPFTHLGKKLTQNTQSEY